VRGHYAIDEENFTICETVYEQFGTEMMVANLQDRSHGYTKLTVGDKVTLVGGVGKLEEVMLHFDA
jgi:Trk K+ transport system NAD-binding subunit